MGKRQMRQVCATAGGVLLLGAMVATPAAAAVELDHEATLADGGYADIRVTSGAGLAGEQLSVLVLEEDATLDAPAAGDVVYLDQRVVDEDGAVSLRVALPSGELDGYWLAVNSTGGTERYVAPLDGEAEEPTEEPTDGPTEEPTDGPTDGPTEEPTDGPTDGPTEEPTDAPTDGPTDGTPGEDPTDGAPDEGPTDGGDGSGDGGAGSGAGGAGPGGAGTGAGGAGAGDGSAGGGDSGGFLSRTGAPVALAAGIALVAVAVGGGVLHLRRRAA